MPRRGAADEPRPWRWRRRCAVMSRLLAVSAVLLALALWLPAAQAMRPDRVAELRRETVKMFYHGFDNYMRVAFPEDELRPVSCVPLTRDNLNPRNIGLNDVLGNYSLTLIDSLSTLAILASSPPEDGDAGPKALRDFQDGVVALVQQYGDGRPGPSGVGQRGRGFDTDSKVQVFETVIRGVGGLLSAHLFAVGELPITGYAPPPPPPHPDAPQPPIAWPNGFVYDGQLLRLALDLATRLLPAFYTPTGMPYPRVNLRHGIPFYVNSPLHADAGADDSGGGGTPTSDDSGGSTGRRRKMSGPPEITETCSAGAGSLVLEFTVLSRLTGDQRFEQLAKRSFWAVWYRRSDIGLIGAGVDAEAGQWIGAYSVIGAGADSFFEYALKTHILLSGHDMPNGTTAATAATAAKAAAAGTTTDTLPRRVALADALAWHDPNALFPRLSDAENAPESFLEAWHLAHAAIKRHLYSDREHPHYVNVNLWTGSLAAPWIDSLGAYYSGLLTLAGELAEAVETNLLYTAVWARYAALPERWSVRDRAVEGGLGWWPLRPEFIESVYHIYRATRDPWYLYVGDMVQRDIRRRCWTACGWAGLQNVVSGEMSDRMESFFLGETAKYMYLLYDERHPLNSLDAAFVYTTEGHPLIIPRRHKTVRMDKADKADKIRKTSKAGKSNKTKIKELPSTPLDRHVTEADRPGDFTHDVGQYEDGGFTNTCPLPPPLPPLTGSAVTARPDLYHAAKMVELHLFARDQDDRDNRDNRDNGDDGDDRDTTFFPWTLPRAKLPANGTSAKVQQPMEMSLEFSSPIPDTQRGAVRGKGSGSAFNTMIGASAAGHSNNNALVRMSHDKIRVHSIASLKLVFRLEEGAGTTYWRVTRVNGVPLGRDESIVLDRALVSHIADARFALVREPTVVKLHHLHHVVWTDETETDREGSDEEMKDMVTDEAEDGSDGDGDGDGDGDVPREDPPLATSPPPSGTRLTMLVKSFWRQIVSSLDGPAHSTPLPGLHRQHHKGHLKRRSTDGRHRAQVLNVVLNATGVTATGLGAGSLPSVDMPAGAHIPVAGPVPLGLLPWMTVYAGGYACNTRDDNESTESTDSTDSSNSSNSNYGDGRRSGRRAPLPETAVRDHQVLVLRRGGCSFSEKLGNIPSFAAGPRRLQLVVVVSDDDDVRVDGGGGGRGTSAAAPLPMTFHDDPDDFVRPLLDATQRTPGGLVRWQPLAMVMVGGGDAAYEQITAARQLGLTRRYVVESQGVRMRNVIIDDGDEL